MKVLPFSIAFLALAGGALANPDATKAVNGLRSDAGLAPVRYNPGLEKAALVHAQDMNHARFFAHHGSDGSDVGTRVRRSGYDWCYVAENIAQGQSGLAEVMAGWLQSPGHRANMLSPHARDFALVQGPGRTWVMVLASRAC